VVDAGLTTLPVPEPDGNQIYVVAPLAVSVVEAPLQIVVLLGVMVTDGDAFTVTVRVLEVLLQLPLEPVTVYTVVEDGLTTLLAPEPDGIQVYVVAPLAVNVVDAPLQIVVLVGVTVITGIALTATVAITAAPTQVPLEPVTVYTVVDAGLTALLAPEPDGNQVYVVAPLAVKVVVPPLQMVAVVGVNVKAGATFTVTVTAVRTGVVQPLLVAST
jgi:hypothetical protein